MKYYGFKFQSFGVEKSKLNRHVGTWIGLIGTFLFLISAVESGGFKGRMGPELWLTIVYPAALWFISLLGVEHSWARKLIIFVSGLASMLSIAANLYLWFEKERIVPSLVCLLILNIGVLVLAYRKDSSGVDIQQ